MTNPHTTTLNEKIIEWLFFFANCSGKDDDQKSKLNLIRDRLLRADQLETKLQNIISNTGEIPIIEALTVYQQDARKWI